VLHVIKKRHNTAKKHLSLIIYKFVERYMCRSHSLFNKLPTALNCHHCVNPGPELHVDIGGHLVPDIRDQLYWTEPDIGTSDIRLR
jgi:hypothetical protein